MHYRLYVFGEKANIVRGIDLDCRDDREAVTEAVTYDNEHGLELWQRETKIASLRPARH